MTWIQIFLRCNSTLWSNIKHLYKSFDMSKLFLVSSTWQKQKRIASPRKGNVFHYAPACQSPSPYHRLTIKWYVGYFTYLYNTVILSSWTRDCQKGAAPNRRAAVSFRISNFWCSRKPERRVRKEQITKTLQSAINFQVTKNYLPGAIVKRKVKNRNCHFIKDT